MRQRHFVIPFFGAINHDSTFFLSMKQQYTWRRKTKVHTDKNTQLTVRHGGGSGILWGCFAYIALEILQHVTVKKINMGKSFSFKAMKGYHTRSMN